MIATLLNVEEVCPGNVARFVRYCAEHGPEHDDSYLPGPHFVISPEQPSYLLVSDGAVVGAVSLMRRSNYLQAGKGRFAIFHSTLDSLAAYARLFQAILPHTQDIRSAYLFLPQAKEKTAAIMRQLGFHVERYSFLLRSREHVQREVRFPPGFSVESLGPTDEAGRRDVAHLINENFSQLAGHTDLAPDVIRSWFDDENYLGGGILVLKDEGKSVGTLWVLRLGDEPHAAEVVAFGIAPRLRRQGLGRMLLRYAAAFAAQRGLPSVFLSVNAENESAVQLYQSEGFVITETAVCYALDCAGSTGGG